MMRVSAMSIADIEDEHVETVADMLDYAAQVYIVFRILLSVVVCGFLGFTAASLPVVPYLVCTLFGFMLKWSFDIEHP